jgi:hypothetical protein
VSRREERDGDKEMDREGIKSVKERLVELVELEKDK